MEAVAPKTNKQTNGSILPITQVPHNKGLHERAKVPPPPAVTGIQ